MSSYNFCHGMEELSSIVVCDTNIYIRCIRYTKCYSRSPGGTIYLTMSVTREVLVGYTLNPLL